MLLSEVDKKTIKNLNRANLYGDTEGVHWLHEEVGLRALWWNAVK